MKKTILILLLLSFAATISLAHPPKKINLKLTGERLSVEVLHESGSVQTHYIKSIEVMLDGKKMIEQHYTLQMPSGQTATYDIPDLAKKYKTLAVTATCSKFGSKTQTLMLKK